jgi:outer membrane scaffolding protein for murein synthesis (MipA/OmpV family)
MLCSPIKKLSLIALLSAAFSSFTYSADIVRTLRTNATQNSEPENFFEIGVGAGLGVGSSLTDEDGKGAGVDVNLRASYNWNGFFIDVFSATSDDVVIGYNAYNHNNWSFDVVLGANGNGITQDNDEEGRFEGLNKREGGFYLGGRATGYYGKNIIQLSLKHDVSGRSQATVASVFMGRNWQHKNWNFHSLVGLSLADKKLEDYFLGVSEEEANRTNFAAYDGNTSVRFNSSVGATYHISKSWEFRATAYAGTDFGRNDSPLFKKKRNFYTGIGLSITHKFQK